MSALPVPGSDPDPHVVVAELGRVGLALTRDAVAAGLRVTGIGQPAARLVQLVQRMADHDEEAARLQEALAVGRLRITDEPSAWAGFDVGVLAAPTSGPSAEFVEAAAVDLAGHLRPGGLIVLAAPVPDEQHGDIVEATVEMLTGLRRGDYGLGFVVCGANPRARPVISSAVDLPCAQRTTAFCRGLGYDTLEVTPPEAARMVALLARRSPAVDDVLRERGLDRPGAEG